MEKIAQNQKMIKNASFLDSAIVLGWELKRERAFRDCIVMTLQQTGSNKSKNNNVWGKSKNVKLCLCKMLSSSWVFGTWQDWTPEHWHWGSVLLPHFDFIFVFHKYWRWNGETSWAEQESLKCVKFFSKLKVKGSLWSWIAERIYLQTWGIERIAQSLEYKGTTWEKESQVSNRFLITLE